MVNRAHISGDWREGSRNDRHLKPGRDDCNGDIRARSAEETEETEQDKVVYLEQLQMAR